MSMWGRHLCRENANLGWARLSIFSTVLKRLCSAPSWLSTNLILMYSISDSRFSKPPLPTPGKNVGDDISGQFSSTSRIICVAQYDVKQNVGKIRVRHRQV